MKFDIFIKQVSNYLHNGNFTQNVSPIAAVMVLFFEKNGVPWIVLTKRSNKLSKHSGQVSFSGGKADPVDKTPLETALRETEEELGIPRNEIKILGRWNDFWTPYYDHVATYIGILEKPEKMVPSEDEIERLIVVPIHLFEKQENHWTEIRVHEGKTYHVHYFKVDGEVVWGATGGVIFYLLRDLGLIKYGEDYQPRDSGLN